MRIENITNIADIVSCQSKKRSNQIVVYTPDDIEIPEQWYSVLKSSTPKIKQFSGIENLFLTLSLLETVSK